MIRATAALPFLRRAGLTVEAGIPLRVRGVRLDVQLSVTPERQTLTVRPGLDTPGTRRRA